jgi:uncharacterized alkaline shock family protein YloU
LIPRLYLNINRYIRHVLASLTNPNLVFLAVYIQNIVFAHLKFEI